LLMNHAEMVRYGTARSMSRLSRGDLNEKIRTRKQRTDVRKYSFVNRTIKS
jgi:hypothetical protein